MAENRDNKTIEIKTKITKKELYEFIMNNNYVSVRGVVSVLFSLISTVGTIYYWNSFSNLQRVLMLFMSLMFTVITPVEYYIRAGRQVKKNFKDEMTYSFDEEGITIKIRDESSSLPWSEVMKVISTRNLIVVYFTPIRAFIIPKNNINEFDVLKEMMEQNTNCYKFKMQK
ncbi:MAG: YcxB family protein [Lachnospiraceae bacterium]|nr:YcxB family protein [Lachnospiraceae bacterium]